MTLAYAFCSWCRFCFACCSSFVALPPGPVVGSNIRAPLQLIQTTLRISNVHYILIKEPNGNQAAAEEIFVRSAQIAVRHLTGAAWSQSESPCSCPQKMLERGWPDIRWIVSFRSGCCMILTISGLHAIEFCVCTREGVCLGPGSCKRARLDHQRTNHQRTKRPTR